MRKQKRRVQRIKKANNSRRNLGELFYSMLGYMRGMSGEVLQPNDFSAMVRAYKHWIYICTKKNSNAVAQLNKRLYVAKGKSTKLISSILTKSVDRKVKDYLFNVSSVRNLPVVRKAIDIEEIIEHNYLDLMKNVNPFENQFGLAYSTQMFLELTGNAYWYIIKNKFGIPSEIWILPSQYMVIVPSDKTFIAGYLFMASTQKIPFDIDEIIHFKFSSPTSRYYGMSPLAAVAYAYNTEENMNKYESGVFKNYGVPFGAFETEQEIDDIEFERIKKQIDLEFKGTEKSGKIALFDKGITFKTYQIPPRDLAFLQGRKLNREVIFAAYDVPVSKVSPDSKFCHDKETEILTDKGWKKYNEVKDIDKIATYNKEKDSLEYQSYIHKFVYDYNEDMVYIKNKQIDICVTPNHKMYFTPYDYEGMKENWQIREVKNLTTRFKLLQSIANYEEEEKKEIVIPNVTSGSWQSKYKNDLVFEADTFIEFLGYVISEGSISRRGHDICVVQKKEQNKEKIDACFKALGSKYSKYDKKNGITEWSIYDKRLSTWFLNNVGDFCQNFKIPRDFLFMSKRQLSILYEALMLGDGCSLRKRSKGGKYNTVYYTSSKLLADDFMILGLKLGYRVLCSISYDWGSSIYVIHISGRRNSSISGNKPISIYNNDLQFRYKKYEGKIFSFEVPNHIYITRRNGRISINGNSNQEIGEYQYMKDAINPRVQYLHSIENEKLLPMYDDNLFVAYDNPIPEDKEFELKKNIEYVKNFVRPVNEIRNIEGLDKVPWGDVPWGGFNLTPLGSGGPPAFPGQNEEELIEESYLSSRLNAVAEQLSKNVMKYIQ